MLEPLCQVIVSPHERLAISSTMATTPAAPEPATVFTIIIPTHDRPALLHRTLMSLARQTFRQFSTIIVSDSSQYIPPYEAFKALPEPAIYMLRSGKPGPAESRNYAIPLVRTPYALFLDDDDTFAPDHLENLAKAIEHGGYAANDIVYCDFSVEEEDRSSQPPTSLKRSALSIPGVSRESIFISNVIPNSCLAFPTPILQSARFDPSLILFEDWDYLLACLADARLVHVPLNSVIIHKSHVAGEENIRRGNVNHEHLFGTTLAIYQRHRAPDENTRQARHQRFLAMGIDIPVTVL